MTGTAHANCARSGKMMAPQERREMYIAAVKHVRSIESCTKVGKGQLIGVAGEVGGLITAR
jgi:flagellar biosynthesis/type III secretory pathway ATPase